MGKFNIGSFFKDVGHKIENVATHPADAIKTIASISPAGMVISNLPKIVSTIEPLADRGLKTVERVGGSIVKEGKHLVGEAVDGAKGLANSLMMPLMIGGAIALIILLKK